MLLLLLLVFWNRHPTPQYSGICLANCFPPVISLHMEVKIIMTLFEEFKEKTVAFAACVVPRWGICTLFFSSSMGYLYAFADYPPPPNARGTCAHLELLSHKKAHPTCGSIHWLKFQTLFHCPRSETMQVTSIGLWHFLHFFVVYKTCWMADIKTFHTFSQCTSSKINVIANPSNMNTQS